MTTKEQQAMEYAMRMDDAVTDKLKANKRKPSGNFHAFDLDRAFRAGWDAALKANASATETSTNKTDK